MDDITGPKQVTRRTFVATLSAGGFGLAASKAMGSDLLDEASTVVVENGVVRLTFSSTSGFLVKLENKLTREVINVGGDSFEVVAEEFTLAPASLRLQSVHKRSEELVEATYS